MTFRYSLFSLILCLHGAWGQQYVISTVAGNGAAGFSGDGGAAASAQLSSPSGLFLDSSGNLYFCDSVNQRVRKISNGTITTIAGNGTSGYSGDKGPATSAALFNPTGVAVDLSGNVFIADASNHVVREVSNGNITTFAGNNTGGYSGDGGPANAAQLAFPTAVTVDGSGNVYIADSGNNAIRKVAGGTIFTILGGDATGDRFHVPNDIAFDKKGNLLIADTQGRRILEWPASGGPVAVLAGDGNIGFSGDDGPAPDATLADPVGVGADSAGYVYVADTVNSRIRKISPSGIITTVAGTGDPAYGGDGGAATAANLLFPRSVVVDPTGKVYIADTGSNTIRMLRIVPPVIAGNGIVNAASFGPQISPGSLATMFGSNFTGTGLQASAALPLPDSLGGVSVSVNGKPAPALYINSKQVNFQVPWSTAPGSAAVTLSVNGEVSNTVHVPVLAAAPGLFFFFGSGRAVVQNQDHTLNSTGNAAKVGSTITAYLTGSGVVSPPVKDGEPASAGPLSKVTASVSATIGSASAQVTFAGLAPEFVGLLQMNIVVPSGLSQGDHPLAVAIGGQASNSATISVTP
jgi:uncharacterized protein (TIGR03437 family)